ncbi:sigma 54-interacting transcriptional regulator [Stigmatella sp. ncwal1]|uniref:Sigma 54-interacting transcriptional regulator n=1 Tax=Stigmatella ashevillensis TaxID=2995309 RepID=A0ABT5D9U0_9BACT|nr:sigma 54-interacting transcriptional regulator [Stigmatella ashevillena]MDC0709082.1 sigma 54-interacting transcriptional regulator [Stigmatella ashevillena]
MTSGDDPKGKQPEDPLAPQQEPLSGPSLNRTTFIPIPTSLQSPPGRESPFQSQVTTRRERALREPAPYREPKALRVQREGVPDLIVPLYPDRSYVFGRAPESTVVFAHDAVSRQHGRLAFREDHRWVYRDLNSRNRSFLGEAEFPFQGDEREYFQVMNASQDWIIEAGNVILLGNGRSRILLLAEVPDGLVAGARPEQAGSAAAAQLERSINICARHQLPVFILGKSGTGKTFIAREIHSRNRLDGNFVNLNCGRLPQDASMLHSELLGHVKGAFTGAAFARVGKFYVANGGTLFLDEVEFLPPAAQDFLIDVLEGTGSLAPLGAAPDSREPPPRFRLISASKTPLQQTGLRPDLAQRLATGDVIILPTLEERRDDIPNLVEDFLHRLKTEQQYDARFTTDALAHLQQVDWPGQIRELETTVKAVVAREGAARAMDGMGASRMVITLEAVKAYLFQRRRGFGDSAAPLPAASEVPSALASTLPVRKRPSDLTEAELRAVLEKHQGNKTRAAQELGIALNTLKDRMKKLGLA